MDRITVVDGSYERVVDLCHGAAHHGPYSSVFRSNEAEKGI